MAAYNVEPGRLVVAGKLDQSNGDIFYKMSLEVLSHTLHKIYLDLSRVTYISSICIGVLATLWLDAHQAGKKMCIMPSRPVSKVLAQAGFDKVFTINNEKNYLSHNS